MTSNSNQSNTRIHENKRKLSVVNILKFIFRYLTPPLLIVVFILKTYFITDIIILPYVYVILLSSIVGYYTNFIAIKMLFRPKRKTFFKRQGLIPKNQNDIAESLGDGIKSNFFDPEDLIIFIMEKDLITNLVTDSKLYLSKKIRDSNTQTKIANWTLLSFKKNTKNVHDFLVNLSEKNLSQFIKNNLDLNTLLKSATEIIEKNIKNGTIDLEGITKKLTTYIHSNVPRISKAISTQLDKYIDEQNLLKRTFLKVGKMVTKLDATNVEQNLYSIVSSTNFRNQVYDQLEQIINKFTEYLNSSEGSNEINVYYNKLISEMDKGVREYLIPAAINKAEIILQSKKTWLIIENFIFKALDFAELELKKLIKSKNFIQDLKGAVPNILEKIDISSLITEKIKKFDTDELEGMILDATGTHLGTIEILGGFLGAFTGIAIFNPNLFMIILLIILVGFVIEYILGRIFNSKLKHSS